MISCGKVNLTLWKFELCKIRDYSDSRVYEATNSVITTV